MNFGELITSFAVSFMAIAGVLTFFYKTVISPIKQALSQIKEHDARVLELNKKIDSINNDRTNENIFENDIRQLMLESLIAILDALENINESNEMSSSKSENIVEAKKRLLGFLSKSIHYTAS